MYVIVIFLTNLWLFSFAKLEDKLDRYIISCHTTDLECFKRQYGALRDNVLFGNERLTIDNYKPYIFKYGDTGTCVQLTGWEKSELNGIKFDSKNKEYALTLETPVKFQQIRNDTVFCELPDNGPLRKFTGNATVYVVYPYQLKKKKGDVYLLLDQENVDVILDIPNLEDYNKNSQFETTVYEASEWTYSLIHHIDAAQHFVLPFTDRIRTVASKLPLRRFILLYPDEDYTNLQFDFHDDNNIFTDTETE